MSTNNRNYIMYGFDLLDLDREELEVLSDLRENGYEPSKEGDITFISCADGRVRHLGVVIASGRDDHIGGFGMFPQEITKTPELTKAMRTLKKQYAFLEGLESKFYILSYFY